MSSLTQLVSEQAKYVRHSEQWMAQTTGFLCNSWQKDACKKYDEGHNLCMSTGSGVGKTAWLANIILHFLWTRPHSIIPCTAPTERQLKNVLWAEIRRWMRKSELIEKMFTWEQERIYMNGYKEDWFATAITATPRPGSDTIEALQGVHAENMCYVGDEASGLADSVLGAIDGCLTNPGARAILTSNPTRNTGYFYQILSRPELAEIWKIIYVNAERLEDLPYFDRRSIERLKVIYGEDSDYYRMRVKGLPPRTEFNALVSPEQIYEAHKRILPRTGHIFLSIDPARYGTDYSVFYIRDGSVILDRQFVGGMDTMQVAKVGTELFNHYDAEECRIDVIGLGAGVYDKMRLDAGFKRNRVKAVHVGENANNNEEFFNKRAEIMWQVRTIIDNISIPIATPLLDEELVTIRYGWDSKDKRIKLESKDVTKSNLGRSPNDADSFGLNCANLKTATHIADKRFFQIGMTNPEGLSQAELVQKLSEDGKKNVRTGVVLRDFLEKRNSYNIGVNRFREFKQDFTHLQERDDGRLN